MDDTISRQAAIEALERDMASLDHIIKGMSANDVRLDAYVSQRNQVNYDIYTINNLPPALGTNLAEVGTDCISRQDALEAFGLSEKTRKYGGDHSGYDTMMMYEIQDTIENLPPIQPEPCEDAVSREAVIDAIDEWKEACADCGHKETVSDIKLIRKDFIELPSVTPKQRIGKWIDVDVMGMPAQACDQCNTFFPLAYTGGGHHYCPNCGAKMEVAT